MKLGEIFHQGKPDPKSRVTSLRAALLLLEHIEYERQERSRDSRTCIGHDYLRATQFPGDVDANRAACRRELHRIGNDVAEDLLQPVDVGFHEHWLAGVDELKVDLLLLDFRGTRFEHRTNAHRQVANR